MFQKTFFLLAVFSCQLMVAQSNPHEYAFGRKCGNHGKDPHHRQMMDTWVANNDTAELGKWLYSEHKALRAYAVAGFYEIWLKGDYVVPKKTIKRIKKIKHSWSRIVVCSGCVYGRSSISRVLRDVKIPEGVSRVSPAVTAILNNLDSMMYYTYGKSCGYIGDAPPYRLKLENAVDNTDTLKLKKWLYSDKKELNAYGVEGYFLLKKKITIPDAILNRIDEVKQDTTMISICRGCVYSQWTLQNAVFTFSFKKNED